MTPELAAYHAAVGARRDGCDRAGTAVHVAAYWAPYYAEVVRTLHGTADADARNRRAADIRAMVDAVRDGVPAEWR